MIDSLSILHITDFHINDELPVGYEFKLSHVAEATIREVTGEKLFVVVSGDIAATGAAKEYDRATHVFDCLFKSIKARFKGDVNLILVPGNHDIYDPPEVVPKYRDDAERKKQLNKMDDFFCFSLECEIDWSNRDVLVSKYPLSPDTGFSDVRFCCLNTVPFSTLEYDKGAHTLTHESLSALCKEDSSELSVVVAHHGPEWLDDTSRLEFETEAARSIDLMVVGHEHRGGTIQQQYSSKSSLPILRGGTFSLDDEGGECTFTVINIGVLQHGEYMADETRFEWDSSSRVFIIRNKNNKLLSLKCLVPRPNGEFVKKLTEEINKDSSFFSDSFSFPRLKSNVSFLPKDDNLISRQSVSILSENDFFSHLHDWECVEIVGRSGSGKSCLARGLYIECLQHGYSPVLIHPNNSTSSLDKTLSSLIREQYGDSPSEIERFRQTSKDKKILIADDFDRIKINNIRNFRKVIQRLLESFGKVIIMVSDGQEVLSRAMFEGDVRACTTYETLEVCPCTKQVRDPLVTKLCLAAGFDDENTDKMIRAVDRAVRGHVGLFELTPAFVTQYVNYFIENHSEMISQDEIPFKHIFDYNIRQNMRKAVKKKYDRKPDLQQVESIVAALQEVAYQMHIRKKSVLDVHEISDIVNAYAEAHDIELKPRSVLEIAEVAGMLTKCDDGYSYSFSSLYIHSYFVANRIDMALDLNEEGIHEQIERLFNEIYIPVNEEIIVFLTQLRLSADFPEKLIKSAKQLVGDEVPKELFNSELHVSLQPLLGMKVSAVNEESAEKIALIEDRMEDTEWTNYDQIEYTDYYDNDLVKPDSPFVKALMAIKYSELIAGYLVKHYAKIPRPTKRKIREALFQIPQSAFGIFISDIDARFDQIVADAASTLSNDCKDDSEFESFLRRLFSAASLGFCYYAMGTVFAHASEGRVTVEYLLKDEGGSFGDDIEELFALFFGGDSEKFVKRAVDLAVGARKRRHFIELLLVQIIVNQYLRDFGRLDQSKKHRLVTGVFGLPGDLSSAKLGLRSQRGGQFFDEDGD